MTVHVRRCIKIRLWKWWCKLIDRTVSHISKYANHTDIKIWFLCVRDRCSPTRFVPKVIRMIFLRSAEGLVKESGGRGRWRGNPGINFDLPQLGPHLCGSRYVSKVLSNSCVLSRAKMQRSLEQRYAIEFCAKLGKSGPETLQLLRTAYGDAVLSSGGTRRSRTEGRALRTNSAQGVLQLQEIRTTWLVWRLFWIGTDLWMCG